VATQKANTAAFVLFPSPFLVPVLDLVLLLVLRWRKRKRTRKRKKKRDSPLHAGIPSQSGHG
jgi:hypothetical protein